MKALDEIKSIVEGSRMTIPFAQDVDKLILESQALTDNSAKVKNALDHLQNHGVNMVITTDFKNCSIKIFDYDFEELVRIGYYPKIEGNTGYLDFDGVKIISQLTMAQADEFSRIVRPFHFWYTDRKANTYDSFKQAIKEIPVESVEHHFYNNDFSNWIKDELKQAWLCQKFEDLKEEHCEGEDLREKMLETL